MSEAAFIKFNEDTAKAEREFNEELYNVIGYILDKAGVQEPAFYHTKWANFTDQIEKHYRKMRMEGIYNLRDFVIFAVTEYYNLTGVGINTSDVLAVIEYVHPALPVVPACEEEVRLADCTSPAVIAHHFIEGAPEVPAFNFVEAKSQLTAVFTNIYVPQMFAAANCDYVCAIQKADTASICTLQYTVMTEILEGHINTSKHSSFFARWFNLQGPLNSTVQNENFLFLCRSLTAARGLMLTQIGVESVKAVVATLLQEYLSFSWFINSDRRRLTLATIDKINAAASFDEIFAILQTVQCELSAADIKYNQEHSWQRMNRNGHSRLHVTLNNAINFASAVTNRDVAANHLQHLAAQMTGITVDKSDVTATSIDTFKTTTKSKTYIDQASATVLDKSITASLRYNASLKYPTGMQGRFNLFKQEQTVTDDLEKPVALRQ